MLSINSFSRVFSPLIQGFKACFNKTSEAVESVQLSHEAAESTRLLNKGWKHYEEGHYQDALDYFNRSIRADSTNHYSNSLRALTHLKLGDLKNAKSNAQDTLAFVESLRGVRRSRALYVLGKIGIDEDRSNVKCYFELALKSDRRNILAQLELAEINLDYRNYTIALQETEKVISLFKFSNPIASPQEIKESLLTAYQLRSHIFLTRGEFGLAKEACQDGLALNSEDRQLTIALAIATSFLNEPISNDSSAFIEGSIIADTLQNKKTNHSLSESDSQFKKIVYLENLGLSQLKEGKYQEALSTFEQGLKEDDSSILFYAHRAIANEKLGNREKALADAKETLKLFQGNVYLDFLEYESAAAALETIANLIPENREKAREIAKALRCGDYMEQQISDSTREEWLALATPPSE